MSKKERVKSKIESIEPVIEKEVVLNSVKDETSDEILEVSAEIESVSNDINNEKEDPSSVAFDEITYIESNEDKLNEPIKIKKIEYDYALDEIEAYINHATKVGNHYLASELHKVSAILSDLNHTFTHLSGEAKLFISIILKNGKILKC